MKRVLSGMQPSGKLHLGNIVGAVNSWTKLQNQFDCFFCIVDWHALTTHYENTDNLAGNRMEMMIDWLAIGIDPEKATLFIQSDIKEHAELHLILSMITPVAWLERVPTYKEKMSQPEGRNLHTYGFLGYPVLQTADIVLYNADIVPVGVDQLPHLELCREIIRTFHHIYKDSLFIEPESMLSETPKLNGTDGRKMSKSYDNAIYLVDEPEDIRKKVMGYVTDTERVKRTDPGDPGKCNLFPLHKIYTDPAKCAEITESCRNASIGCVDCKKIAVESVLAYLAPIQERRRTFSSNPGRVREIFSAGTAKARLVAAETMDKVNHIIKIK